jgi:hypothetical protein
MLTYAEQVQVLASVLARGYYAARCRGVCLDVCMYVYVCVCVYYMYMRDAIMQLDAEVCA